MFNNSHVGEYGYYSIGLCCGDVVSGLSGAVPITPLVFPIEKPEVVVEKKEVITEVTKIIKIVPWYVWLLITFLFLLVFGRRKKYLESFLRKKYREERK